MHVSELLSFTQPNELNTSVSSQRRRGLSWAQSASGCKAAVAVKFTELELWSATNLFLSLKHFQLSAHLLELL